MRRVSVQSFSHPLLAWKKVVDQQLFDPGDAQRGCIPQFHLFQLRRNLFGLLACR